MALQKSPFWQDLPKLKELMSLYSATGCERKAARETLNAALLVSFVQPPSRLGLCCLVERGPS